MANAMVQVRRAYEDPAQGDGTRVLAGRIWPRGLTKARAALDEVSAFENRRSRSWWRVSHLPEHAWGRCQASEVSWRFSCHL